MYEGTEDNYLKSIKYNITKIVLVKDKGTLILSCYAYFEFSLSYTVHGLNTWHLDRNYSMDDTTAFFQFIS